nr:cation diffusion facilitator family transporter [Desulfobacterales bacterium]
MFRHSDYDSCSPGSRAGGGDGHSSSADTKGNPADNHGAQVDQPHHVAVENRSGSRLLVTLALNLIIPAVEVAGGVYAHSTALISDAIHNLGDFTAILIAYLAHRIGQKEASVRNTFGYRRAEIIAAVLNVLLLVGACAFIVYKAVSRLQHPEVVSAYLVVWVASIGVLGNGFSAWLLHRDSRHSLNVRGAFLHMLGDLLTSIAVILSGLILIFKPWYWLDPLLSLLIVLFILKNCWSILKEASSILMNATPPGLDVQEVKGTLEQIPGVIGVHYIHAWNVSSSSIAFSCHVVVSDQPVSKTEPLAEEIRNVLLHRFGIDHPVLQFETAECGGGSVLCKMSCGGSKNPPHTSVTLKRDRLWDWRTLPFLVLRLLMGSVFVYASLYKIVSPEAFAETIYNYQIVPGGLINLTAIILPWLELVLGAFLILGVWLPGSILLSTLLLATFFGLILFNFVRGLDIDCGCFKTSDEVPSSVSMVWYLIRNGALLLLVIYLFSHTLLRRRTNE